MSVTTVCAPDSDTIGVRIESPLIAQGKLRVRLGFPLGHDLTVKNTPALDWSNPEAHESKVIEQRAIGGTLIQRKIDETRYAVIVSKPVTQSAPHIFRIAGNGKSQILEFSIQFLPGDKLAA